MRAPVGVSLKARPFWILALAAALLSASAAASQDGSGVIVEANPSSTFDLGPLNPLLCYSEYCQRIVDFLFPTLFAYDPANGALVGAADDNHALVVEPSLQAGDVQTLRLRDELTWSDGAPVTAYDVFYSYLASASSLIDSPYRPVARQIFGAQVIDEHTIALQYAAPDCSSFARSNLPIVPAHVFDTEFASFVDAMNAAQGDTIQPLETWLDAYPETNFSDLWGSDFNQNPTTTAGIFGFDALRPAQDIRLLAGDTAFVYADIPGGLDPVAFFLSGKADVLVNPVYERRDDLRASPGLQIAEFAGWTWDYIVFNTADPLKARDGFNDQGQPIEQGLHSIFADVRVRRAVQLAIDVDELIEVVYQGNATPIASSIPPASWAYNPKMTPVTYDPAAAAALLEEAGWKDTDRDGIRECHGCLYAEEWTPLIFELYEYPDERLYVAGALVSRQLSKVGFYVEYYPESADSQEFDAFLGSRSADDVLEAFDPDQSRYFTRAGDVVWESGNVGSYYNEQIEALMEAARTAPDCDLDARAELYREIQAILQEDQPYVWLYVRNEMAVAQPGVKGFAPYPAHPFWNIRDWVVTR